LRIPKFFEIVDYIVKSGFEELRAPELYEALYCV
jgi:hypothetical protein